VPTDPFNSLGKPYVCDVFRALCTPFFDLSRPNLIYTSAAAITSTRNTTPATTGPAIQAFEEDELVPESELAEEATVWVEVVGVVESWLVVREELTCPVNPAPGRILDAADGDNRVVVTTPSIKLAGTVFQKSHSRPAQ
jgi:hypothetical protein